jgi:NAD(P)-dependent dehydrogenase (short-subunit alcohol dehydrogenase family)
MSATATAAPHDRVAVVTGAGSGVGRATAALLLADGWRVAYAGRRDIQLQEAVSSSVHDWGETARRALVCPTDVTDPQQVRRLFDIVCDRFGRIDLLFNNAGRVIPGVPLEDLSLSQWREVVDTNLTGSFLCLQQAFRVMKAQDPRGGRIINNGSVSAHTPRPHSLAYTASKHAITGLTKSASLDGRAFGIAVGQIDIGNTASGMTGPLSAGVPQADGSLRTEPVMDTGVVARAVVHMASLPLEANVQFMTVLPTQMPFIGRG